MATDIKKIIDNLLNFYEFSNKKIISIGAGGGQFIEYGRHSEQVIAIDNDNEAIVKLQNALQSFEFKNKFTLINSNFYAVDVKGDVVLFEFCLHEMSNPEAAINQALTMAPNVVVADHGTTSEWAYVVDEKEKVMNSWNALSKFNPKKVQEYDTVQYFHNYDELYQKVKVQGINSIKRIEQYRNKVDFAIPMTYDFALI